MFSGFESLYGSSMPQFVTANRRREVPVSPPLINLGSFGPVGGPKTLEEQGAAAKLAHPNLRGGMLTMANKHQSDKEIAAAKNEAYWLNQAALHGAQFKPGQEHWTDPMARFFSGSDRPGSGILAPIDYAGGAASLLKLGVKAGAAALGGLMLKDFIKNPPEPGTLFSVFGHGTSVSKLKGGKFNLRFVADGTKGQGANSFGWGIYFAESKSTSGGYARTRKWNTVKFIKPLEKELKALNSERKKIEKQWGKLDARARKYRNQPGMEGSLADDMTRNLERRKINSSQSLLVEEKIRAAKRINTFDPESALKIVEENRPNSEVVRGLKEDVMPDLKTTGGGSHLKVDISDAAIGARGDKLMDWYVPLNDHPAEVQQKIIKAIRSVMTSKSGRHIPDSEILDLWGNKTGGAIYGDIATHFRRNAPSKVRHFITGPKLEEYDKMVSELLNKSGISGARFQSGTLTLNNADIVKTWAKPDNIDMNLVIWDQKVLDGMDYLGEF